jgi:hypothetical protein
MELSLMSMTKVTSRLGRCTMWTGVCALNARKLSMSPPTVVSGGVAAGSSVCSKATVPALVGLALTQKIKVASLLRGWPRWIGVSGLNARNLSMNQPTVARGWGPADPWVLVMV